MTVPQLHWNLEYGERLEGPQDPDYQPNRMWIKRVPTGKARFTCSEHYAVGWDDAEKVKLLAGQHLKQEHGVLVPWLTDLCSRCGKIAEVRYLPFFQGDVCDPCVALYRAEMGIS